MLMRRTVIFPDLPGISADDFHPAMPNGIPPGKIPFAVRRDHLPLLLPASRKYSRLYSLYYSLSRHRKILHILRNYFVNIFFLPRNKIRRVIARALNLWNKRNKKRKRQTSLRGKIFFQYGFLRVDTRRNFQILLRLLAFIIDVQFVDRSMNIEAF